MNHVQPPVPPITTLLQGKGRNTLGHETNLARSPIWHARPRSSEDDTVLTPMLFGHPFRKIEGRPLTTTDQRLFAQLTTSYVRLGCPADRQVPFSLSEAAAALGHEVLGGKQRSLVRASLGRLRSATFESAVRHPDGHETVLGWGLIDSYLVTTRGGGKGWVQLSEPLGHLLSEGSVTFLHSPTWNAICDEDEVAGRLWSFLESETIGAGWRYSLFTADGIQPSRSMPSIAEVVQLNWSSRKRRVTQRVREACSVIETHDRRYRLTVASGKSEGSWVLTCTRASTPRANGDTISDTILNAWRQVFRSHLPSRRQRAVLTEILTRRSPEWIVRHLLEADGQTDPFRHVLTTDSSLSKRDLSAAMGRGEAEGVCVS
jgi:hypothetical protein